MYTAIYVFVFQIMGFAALADEIVEKQVQKMTDKTVSWKDRSMAEDVLTGLPPKQVLQALAPHLYLTRPHFAVLVAFENVVLAVNPRPLCVAYGFGPSSP